MGVPARHKKLWLAEKIREALVGKDDGEGNTIGGFVDDVDTLYGSNASEPIIEMEVREWKFSNFQNHSMRISIMGKPIWYVEVLFTGPTTTLKEKVDRSWLGGIHEYAVALFLEFRDTGSTTLFEDMTDSEVFDKEGLMVFLKNQGISRIEWPNPTSMDVDAKSRGDVIMSIRETGDENTYRDLRSVVNLNYQSGQVTDRAHLLEFRVNIADIL